MKKILIFLLIIQIQNINSQKILKDYPLSKIIEETSGLEIIGDYFCEHIMILEEILAFTIFQ